MQPWARWRTCGATSSPCHPISSRYRAQWDTPTWRHAPWLSFWSLLTMVPGTLSLPTKSGNTARRSDLASRTGLAHATAVVHDERCHLLFGDVFSRTTDEKTWSAQKHASLSESSHAPREQQKPKIHATKCAAISAPKDHHFCETTTIQDTRRRKSKKPRTQCDRTSKIFPSGNNFLACNKVDLE